MIRIISGRMRGRRLQAPKKLPVRPTTDRAKESLFNILNNHFYFEDIQALDLFCGTGNISYELASRGCKDITAVDTNRGCIKYVNQVAKDLQLDELRIISSEAFKFIEQDFSHYDFIFADPPYDFEEYYRLVDQVMQGKLLKPDGLMVIEHQSRLNLEEVLGFQSSRKYGNVAFSFFGHLPMEESSKSAD